MSAPTWLSGARDWFFDCDGVLLDSNEVKTRAFGDVARHFGGDAEAEALMSYHRANGGISRFVKWQHFFDGILGRPAAPGEYEMALAEFARRSRAGAMDAPEDPAVADLVGKLRTNGCCCHVVSGAAQDELRDVLDARGLAELFDSVNGSPTTKIDIVDSVRSSPSAPGVFVGDSRLDHDVSVARGLAFVFVSHWSEFDQWTDHFAGSDALVVPDLSALSGAVSDALSAI